MTFKMIQNRESPHSRSIVVDLNHSMAVHKDMIFEMIQNRESPPSRSIVVDTNHGMAVN